MGLIIFIFILICLIQRCCACRQKRKARAAGGNTDSCTSDSDNNAENAAREHMLSVDMPPDASVVFKPDATGGAVELTTPSKKVTLTEPNGTTHPTAPPEEDVEEERDDFIPIIIGPDGRPRSHPPSYDDVLMEDTRMRRGHHAPGGLFRRIDNDLYEDELIREDNKL